MATRKTEFVKKDNAIYGMHPVMEAIQNQNEIDKVFIQSDLRGPHIGTLRKLIKTHKIASQNIPLAKLDHLYRGKHQGVVALLSPIEYQPYESVVSQAYENGETPLMLVLDRVSDVGNFGAICRSAECLGVHGIIIPVKGAAQINAEAIKRSSGALLNVNISRERDLAAVVENLKHSGLQIIACTEKSELPVSEVSYQGPTVVIMGSEEDGVNSTLMKLADHKATIPMLGNTASLNVSVSTGIILYEISKQRK